MSAPKFSLAHGKINMQQEIPSQGLGYTSRCAELCNLTFNSTSAGTTCARLQSTLLNEDYTKIPAGATGDLLYTSCKPIHVTW